MKYPVLLNAVSRRGASMGRDDGVHPEDIFSPIKFRLYRMPMYDGGCYDSGGAYWGCGSWKTGFMYHAYGAGANFMNQLFIRATSREDAKKQIRSRFSNARFYR